MFGYHSNVRHIDSSTSMYTIISRHRDNLAPPDDIAYYNILKAISVDLYVRITSFVLENSTLKCMHTCIHLLYYNYYQYIYIYIYIYLHERIMYAIITGTSYCVTILHNCAALWCVDVYTYLPLGIGMGLFQ